MGQTRVDLRHLLEDLRDAYPGAIEETILSEAVANALDSGAASIRVLVDAGDRTVVVVDDGSGMSRSQVARYHDLAATSKTRGQGIGFAGVGNKLGLLIAEAVLTESRRGSTHTATRWHLASRHKAPWQWVPPPGWVGERGTAVGLKLRNALSPLLDPGYVEAMLRLHFEPLFDPAFDEMLAPHYPQGVTFGVNGRTLDRVKSPTRTDRALLGVKLPRKRRLSASGFLERASKDLPEDRQGLAVSTLGKVIRRGWDWVGLSPTSPRLVSGLIEAPGLAEALTLNKGDFVRAGKRGITYLGYRKAMQEAVQSQLTAWGETRSEEDRARRKATRPVERDLEAVLIDLAEDFPALAALVERRAGGQRRLPTGQGRDGSNVSAPGADGAPGAAASAADLQATGDPDGAERPTQERPSSAVTEAPEQASVAARAATGSLPPMGKVGPRRATRYGLAIDFEERAGSPEMGRLVESSVFINTAHPAYGRAVASRSEGYHAALSVGMALAAVAVEPSAAQDFLSAFLARWGGALGSDRRRRQTSPRRARSAQGRGAKGGASRA